MKTLDSIQLSDVQNVYAGPERLLWELIMGEQIHIGGLASSMDLAQKAAIHVGMTGIDLCCCTGAGMRFLVRFFQVDKMTGVDATEEIITLGKERTHADGLTDSIRFVMADVCASGLPDACANFVWGEDAWCYVEDKSRLVSEAVRLVKPGGTIAFTDWVEGITGLSEEEAKRFLTFMKFPSLYSLEDYRQAFENQHCHVEIAEDTERFAPAVRLYLEMINSQLTYDALKIVGFNQETMQAIGEEMMFMQSLADDSKIAQGLLVVKKP